MSHRGALLVVADTWEKGWLSAFKGVEVLPVAVVSGRHLAHNRPTGLHCHNPEISARAEMTAHTGASHPRTAHVHQRMSPITLSSQRVWRWYSRPGLASPSLEDMQFVRPSLS